MPLGSDLTSFSSDVAEQFTNTALSEFSGSNNLIDDRQALLDRIAHEYRGELMKMATDAYFGITPREVSPDPNNPLYAIDGVYQYPELFEGKRSIEELEDDEWKELLE